MSSRKRTLPPLPSTAASKDEDIQNLYVFGYQCKLFRDDEKASYIERNGHLIPWMGEANLLIDRYDGRGHLHDLRPHDADRRKDRTAVKLSDEERQLEAACDEERYMELNSDWMEKILYEEEELKRLHEALGEDTYGAVGFSYDQANVDGQQQQNEDEADIESEQYEPPPELRVPTEFIIPETVNMNAIIEKTATFISKHGTQMEIMIKTKQKDNLQFDFLNYDNALFPFYRHMVHMIKCGRYKPGSHSRHTKRRSSGSEENAGYLHPSLMKVSSATDVTDYDPGSFLRIVSEKLPAGQISNTPYAALVQRLGKHTGRDSPLVNSDTAAVYSSKPSSSTLMSNAATSHNVHSSHIANHTATHHSEHHQLPPVPGMEPVILPSSTPRSDNTHYNAHHGSLVDTNMPEVPLPEARLIIDKMAMYVAKNGPEFEIVVKSKTDTRFEFLQSWHKHFAYYDYMKKLHQQTEEACKPSTVEKKVSEDEESDDSEEEEEEEGTDSEDSQATTSKAVSFSIKAKDADTTSLAQRSTKRAVLYESSDDEQHNNKGDGDGTNVTETSDVTVDQSVDSASKRPDKKTALSAQQIEKRHAEERVRDRLAGAARGKLAQTSKDKQLKAERKRKAAMFISLLRGVGVTGEHDTSGGTMDAVSSDASDVPATASCSQRCSRASSPQQLYVTSDQPPAVASSDLYMESRPQQLYTEDTPLYMDNRDYNRPPSSLYLEPDRPQLYMELYPEYPRSSPDQRYSRRPRESSPSHHKSRSRHRKSRQNRSRSPKSSGRKRSKTPPTAYNTSHRPSKSPSCPDTSWPPKRRDSTSTSRDEQTASIRRKRSRSPAKKHHKSSNHRSKSSSKSSSHHRKSRHRSRSPNSRRKKDDSDDDSTTNKCSGLTSGDDCIIIDDDDDDDSHISLTTPPPLPPSAPIVVPSPPPPPMVVDDAVVVASNGTAGTEDSVPPVTSSAASSDTPVPEDLLFKVRAILKASRGES